MERATAQKGCGMWTRGSVLVLGLLLATAGAAAGEADVVGAEARRTADGSWRFEVTVRHADTGWEHYADKWEVLAPDGRLLGERILLHPHVEEQPFTRTLAGVAVPAGIREVRIRAHDSVHGYGGRELRLELP